jgi:6Fe-6S prismane cluster-containing protein
MFCNQCEQTARGICCDKSGVCGKKPEVAAIQDLIVYASRGLAVAAGSAGQEQAMRAGRLCTCALFSTVTNVNFDMEPLIVLLHEVVAMRDAILKTLPKDGRGLPVLAFAPAKDENALFSQAEELACIARLHPDSSCNSLAQTLLFGLKGLSAYADHAAILGHESEDLYRSLFDALSYGFDERPTDLSGWLGKTMDCGHHEPEGHGAA